MWNETKAKLEHLMTYAPAILFYEENTGGNPKMRKMEQRCEKLMQQCWSISDPLHMFLRQYMRNIDAIVQLCCNDVCIGELIETCAKVDFYYKQLVKQREPFTKQEPYLKDYYAPTYKIKFDKVTICLLDELFTNKGYVLDKKIVMCKYEAIMKQEAILYKDFKEKL